MGSGSNSAQREAQRAEAERQRRIAATTGQINAAYDAPGRQSQYDDFLKAVRQNYTDDATRQKRDVDRSQKFSLARSGLTGGSAAVDANSRGRRSACIRRRVPARHPPGRRPRAIGARRPESVRRAVAVAAHSDGAVWTRRDDRGGSRERGHLRRCTERSRRREGERPRRHFRFNHQDYRRTARSSCTAPRSSFCRRLAVRQSDVG